MIVFTRKNALEAGNRILQGDIFAGGAGEHFRNVERLGQEALDFPRAGHRLLVFFGQFIHTENGDDVLQFLVALQNRLHATGHVVVFLADHQGVELAAGGVQRIYRGVNTLGGDVARQYHGGIQVGESGCRRRVSQVVRRHVNRLDRGNGAGLGGGDAFLQHTHFLCQRRLVTHRRRHTAKQCGHLGTGQRVAVDIVDEQQYVTAFIAELLGHGEAGQGNAQTVTGRLVHLAVNHRYLGLGEVLDVNHARFLHLVVEVVTFTGTLTDTREHGQTRVLGGDVVDELHHVHGLAHTGTAEQADFTALGKRADQVDNLDAGFEQFFRSGQLVIGRRLAVNRGALLFANRATLVDRVAEHVHDAAERLYPDGHIDRGAGIFHRQIPAHTFGRAHGNGAHNAITQLLLDFQGQAFFGNQQCIVNLGYVFAWKLHVDHGTDNLYDSSAAHVRILCIKVQFWVAVPRTRGATE